MLLALVLGLPVIVAGSLAGADLDLRASVGSQPGGLIEGAVAAGGDWGDELVQLAGQRIELYTLESSGERTKVAEVHTDAAGEFAFEAPPIEGKYEVAAGGGLLQRVLREGSFLDQKGQLIEPQPLELPLRRGCILEVVLVSPSGTAPISGHYDLSGELEEGAFLGLLHPRFRCTSAFEDGHIELGGLPPLTGTLHIFFGIGESLKLDLTLEPGETTRRIEL